MGLRAQDLLRMPRRGVFRGRCAAMLAIVGVWLACAVAGHGILLNYANAPGPSPDGPGRWPQASSLQRETTKPMLLMFVHPHCPCSRASIGELARVMCQLRERAPARVLIVRPATAGPDWEETDLCNSARAIPGVQVSVDMNGHEARLFQAATSGTVLLYGENGELRFSGGITAARGHSGDNLGAACVIAAAFGSSAHPRETPVFGCPLFENGQVEPLNTNCSPVAGEKSCCQ